MKKTLITLLLALIFGGVFAQITPGRYIIKLSANLKSLEVSGYEHLQISATCPDYNVNCQNQIWDIKPVRGTTDLFYIQSIKNRKCLTFRDPGEAMQVMEDLFLEPLKPNTQIRNQSFYITDAGDGKFTIQPQRATGELIKENNVYLTGEYNNLTSDGSMIKFLVRNNRNLAVSYFTLFNIPTVVRNINTDLVPRNRGNFGNTVSSDPVIVAPLSDNKIDIDFKTSDDNLEVKSFQENLEVRIIIQNKADAILTNANKNESWPNNSVRRVSLPLPPNITSEDIKEIHLYRKPKGGIKYVWELGEKDNWNLSTITAVATIMTNGVKKRSEFEKIITPRRGKPLFRFIYEGGDNLNEGTICKKVLIPKTIPLPAPENSVVAHNNAYVEMVFGTGGDNLEGGNNNAEIKIRFKNSPRIILLRNINESEKWNNFSEKSKTKEILNTTNIDINDIKEVEISHTGGGGIGADNWDVDKIKISIIKDGQTKILVDRVDTPIHRFTGDRRSKIFRVE